MKKTPLLLTLAVLAIITGGFFAYERFFAKAPLQPWDLVPSETVFVYEKDRCSSCIENMQQTSLWQILSKAAFYNRPLDSLRSSLSALATNAQGLLVSAHVTGKDDFDFIYYVPASESINPGRIFPNISNYRYSERELNQVKIHELSSQRLTFSWIIIDNIWIGSFTPFLIEDVIRTYNGKPNFMAMNSEVKRLPRINGDAGNIYLQLRDLPDLLSVFTVNYGDNLPIARTSLLDIRPGENSLVLNGFSLDSASQSGFLLSLFRGQSPVSFSLKNLVPNRALTFTSYGISDGAAFAHELSKFNAKATRHMQDSLRRISSGLQHKWEDLFADVRNEIGLCVVEGVQTQRLHQILIVETQVADRWMQNLNDLSEKQSSDTVFYERFASYIIREMPVRRFAEKLFSPLVTGFDQTFYTVIGNRIIFGDHLEELKYFLEDIEHEDIWGKSVAKNQFLESTLLESNVSLYVNTPRVWNVLMPKLNSRWRQFARDNQSLLQSMQLAAFQFSHLNNTFYTNITVNHTKAKAEVTFASAAKRNIVHFAEPVRSVHTVRSHVSSANEILIQDSLNNLSLLSLDGRIQWKISVGDAITSDIQQIDFFKNGKLQYIFSTRSAIHIIDRLGNYVQPYPLMLDGKNIRQLSVIDYDRSKNYRFMIAEENGRIWMFDKSGNNLEGWNPRNAGGSLLSPPAHHRIKGKDFILAIRKDGEVQLFNRRGEMLPGFPLNLQGTPAGDYFLETGRDMENTFFVVATREGHRIRFNPLGNIQGRETLLRSSVNSQFGLIAEKAYKSYLILQHDSRQLSLSDASGKKLIVSEYVSPKDLEIEYYRNAGGQTYTSITDKVQELSYVFDGAGVLITNPPLESTSIELFTINSDQTYAVFIHDKSLTVQPLTP